MLFMQAIWRPIRELKMGQNYMWGQPVKPCNFFVLIFHLDPIFVECKGAWLLVLRINLNLVHLPIFEKQRKSIAKRVTGWTCSHPANNGLGKKDYIGGQLHIEWHLEPVLLQLKMDLVKRLNPPESSAPAYMDCIGGELRIEWQVEPVLLLKLMGEHQPKHHSINPVSTSLCCWVVQILKPTNTNTNNRKASTKA